MSVLSAPSRAFVISDHALRRFRDRTGSTKSDAKLRSKLLAMLTNARQVQAKRHYGTLAILKYGCPADYYRFDVWVFVVIDGIVVTVHQGEAERWEC